MMYFNTYAFDHVYSWTRMYITLFDVYTMTIIMFLYMRNMYKDKPMNIGIIILNIAVFRPSLFLGEKYEPIEDVRWMKALIPHYSIAILINNLAEISDQEVKRLVE